MNPQTLSEAVLAALALNLVPAILYAGIEPASRTAWAEGAGEPLRIPGGSYRSAVIWPAEVHERAPRAVRLAAYSCLLLGQLCAPLAALLAAWAAPPSLVGALGALSPEACSGFLALAPAGFAVALVVAVVASLVTTVRLCGAGRALLRREPDAADRALRVACGSFALGALGLLALGYGADAVGPAVVAHNTRCVIDHAPAPGILRASVTPWSDLTPWVLLAGFQLAALAQAALLACVARATAARTARRAPAAG